MDVGSAKRVHHLARYFGMLAFLCLFGYSFLGLAYPLLVLLGPPLFLTYLLRAHVGFLVGWIPNLPIVNQLFLFFPLTIIYFGLVGFQLKNIINERGKIRVVVLAVFVLFLIYIHSLAFKEISLYWEGSSKLVPLAIR